MVIPADTAQIDDITVGTATPGTTVTVTAQPIGNVVLTGYPTGGWSHTVTSAAPHQLRQHRGRDRGHGHPDRRRLGQRR